MLYELHKLCVLQLTVSCVFCSVCVPHCLCSSLCFTVPVFHTVSHRSCVPHCFHRSCLQHCVSPFLCSTLFSPFLFSTLRITVSGSTLFNSSCFQHCVSLFLCSTLFNSSCLQHCVSLFLVPHCLTVPVFNIVYHCFWFHIV